MSVVLATAGYDHIIRFWEAPTGACIRMIKFGDSQINRLEITPDKQFIAAAGNPLIRLYEIQQSGNTILTNHNTSSSNGEKGSHDPAVLTLEGHTGNVTSLGFQKDGRYLYTGSEDGTLKVWDLSNPYCSRSYNVGAPVNSVCLRADRDEFVTGDQNGFVKIWDLGGSGTKGGLIHSVKPSAPSSAFESLSQNTTGSVSSNISVDSSTITEDVNDNTNRRNNTKDITGQRIRRTNQPFAQQNLRRYAEGIVPIQTVDISEDSRTLVAVSNRGTVYVWDPSSNNNLSLLQNMKQSPDDPTNDAVPTTVNSDGYLRPITKFRAHTEHPGTYCLHGKIAPDCRHLVTTASDGTAKLWDTTTWELTQALIQQPAIPSVDRNQRGGATTNSNKGPPPSKWVWEDRKSVV